MVAKAEQNEPGAVAADVRDASALPADITVRVVDGPAGDATIDALRDAFPGTTAPFPVPSSLANAERIAGLPLLLAMGAAVLGLAGARWGWHVLAESFGLVSGPVVPLWVAAAGALAALVVASLGVTPPARRAASMRVADALRVE